MPSNFSKKKKKFNNVIIVAEMIFLRRFDSCVKKLNLERKSWEVKSKIFILNFN